MHQQAPGVMSTLSIRVLCKQEEEGNAEVWEAALGCLLQMCFRDGGVVESAVHGLPPATARGLLHSCRTFGWCDGRPRRSTCSSSCPAEWLLASPSPQLI